MLGNQKGETLIDILQVVGMVLLLTFVPFFFIYRDMWWLGMMVAIMLVFGAVELTVKLVTGKTLSQRFWRWSATVDANGKYKHFWKAVGVILALIGGWALLMLHLGWKLLTGKKYDEQGNKV